MDTKGGVVDITTEVDEVIVKEVRGIRGEFTGEVDNEGFVEVTMKNGVSVMHTGTERVGEVMGAREIIECLGHLMEVTTIGMEAEALWVVSDLDVVATVEVVVITKTMVLGDLTGYVV